MDSSTQQLDDATIASVLFGRLTAEQLHDKRALVAAYTDTWLRKRQTPAIPLEHIFPLLDKSADIVTRARELESRESRITKKEQQQQQQQQHQPSCSGESTEPSEQEVAVEQQQHVEQSEDVEAPSGEAMTTDPPQSQSQSQHNDDDTVESTTSSSGIMSPTVPPVITLEGSSAEFLLTEAEHPLTRNTSPKLTAIMDKVNENAKDFVRRLVHATLRDADGYVHSFSSERIDQLVDRVLEHDAALLVNGGSGSNNCLSEDLLGERGRALETALALEWSATQAIVYAALNSWRDDEYLFHDNSPSILEQEEAKAIDSLVGNAAYQRRLEAVRASLAAIRTEMLHITDQRSSEKDHAAVNLRSISQEPGSPPYVTNVEELTPEPSATSADATDSKMEVETQQQHRQRSIEEHVLESLGIQSEPSLNHAVKPPTPTPTSTPKFSAPNLSGDDGEQVELATEEIMETEESDLSEPTRDSATATTTTTTTDGASAEASGTTPTANGDAEEPQGDADATSSNADGRSKLRSSSTRLEVQRVASDVERWDDHARRLEKLYASLDTQKLLEGDPAEAKKTLLGLHKNATVYIGNLMVDLDALDRLAVSESTRQLRKAQIVQISQLLDSLEAIKHKIEDLMRQVDAKLAEQQQQQQAEAEAAAAAAAAKEQEQAQAQETQPAEQEQQEEEQEQEPKTRRSRKQRRVDVKVDDKEPDDENLFWRRLKLEPHFEISETRDSFELLSMIPGMNPDEISIKVSDDGSLLTLSGFRGPTAQEKAEMARVLERQRYEQQRLMYGRSAFIGGLEERRWDDAEMLVRLGAGRFGSFAKSFELPPHGVDTNDISATYERGVLRVSVPKTRAYIQKQRQQQQQQQQQRQRRQGQRDMFGGMGPFGRGYPANDFWW